MNRILGQVLNKNIRNMCTTSHKKMYERLCEYKNIVKNRQREFANAIINKTISPTLENRLKQCIDNGDNYIIYDISSDLKFSKDSEQIITEVVNELILQHDNYLAVSKSIFDKNKIIIMLRKNN